MMPWVMQMAAKSAEEILNDYDLIRLEARPARTRTRAAAASALPQRRRCACCAKPPAVCLGSRSTRSD